MPNVNHLIDLRTPLRTAREHITQASLALSERLLELTHAGQAIDALLGDTAAPAPVASRKPRRIAKGQPEKRAPHKGTGKYLQSLDRIIGIVCMAKRPMSTAQVARKARMRQSYVSHLLLMARRDGHIIRAGRRGKMYTFTKAGG